ncbi:MAG: hypothetical protein ACRDOI_39185 [Trebonia sp.]
MAQNSFADSIRRDAGRDPQANLAWLRKSQRKYRRMQIGSAILAAAVIALCVLAAISHQLDQRIITASPVVLATGVFNFFRARQIVDRCRAAEERLLERHH